MFNRKAFLQNLTHHPGVYQMLGEKGEVLYIGKAKNLKKRLSSYFSSKSKDVKTTALLKHITDIQVIVTHNEVEALLLECNLIKKYKPHYNILFRDDKSFPYIFISMTRPYPCIDFYRGQKKEDGIYFGPYPHSASVRETIHFIQKVFGLRVCDDRYSASRKRPCLQYQIGMCSGSCASLISEDAYQEDVQRAILFLQGKNEQILDELNQKMEQFSAQLNYEKAATLRDQISKLREIQARQYVSSDAGDVDVIGLEVRGAACIQLLIIRGGRILGSRAYFPNMSIEATNEDIISSFISQHYLSLYNDTHMMPKEIIVDVPFSDCTLLQNTLSEIAKRKVVIRTNVKTERKKWLNIANASAKQSLTGFLNNQSQMHERLAALQNVLGSKKKLTHIECFDVSHTMGEATVASCVVFNEEGPVKSSYRRFNIQGITPGDDMAAMHQALHRRYLRRKTDEARLPDLIIIDGGTTQLSAAIQTMQALDIQDVILIGVAKGVTRKPGYETLHLVGKAPMHLSSDSKALHFLQQVRDEAHRFAITGHRKQRDKKRQRSVLEEIPGIGAKRRRELLRYFGGIQAIKRASLDELANVPGISQFLAKRIFQALHEGGVNFLTL